MKLLTEAQHALLLANGRRQQSLPGTEREIDLRPVVKLFNPCGAATWLLTELDPDEPDIAFGLCDLGMGFLELGSVRLSELASVRGPLGLGIERDLHFVAVKTLGEYAEEADRLGLHPGVTAPPLAMPAAASPMGVRLRAAAGSFPL